MSTSEGTGDPRPRTAVLQQFGGMGDLVWHVPYYRKIAETSRDGQVSVIASPTTFAAELVGHEAWVREVIDFDRRPRVTEQRQGRHSGLAGLFRMSAELRAMGFERIVLFSYHSNRILMACLAGIPQRLGYGTSWLQRRLLSRTPWIKAYEGSAVAIYKDSSALAVAQGWCDAPIVPRLRVRPDALDRVRQRLADLPRPLDALSIGTSEPHKQWGAENFAALVNILAAQGHGVLVVGGPAEAELAQSILRSVEPGCRSRVASMTDGTVAETVAAMSLAGTCVGNDTGATNIAAAVQTPTFLVLGPRPDLEHDPEYLHLLKAPCLGDIRPEDVARCVLGQDGAG